VKGPAGNETLQAGRALILATGSRPRSLPGVSIDEKLVISSNGAVRNETRPASIVVIGAGAVGVEFADVYASYGTQVTLLEALPRVLPPGNLKACNGFWSIHYPELDASKFANFAAVTSHAAQVGLDTVITLDAANSITLTPTGTGTRSRSAAPIDARSAAMFSVLASVTSRTATKSTHRGNRSRISVPRPLPVTRPRRAVDSWTPTASGSMNGAIHKSESPCAAPTCE